MARCIGSANVWKPRGVQLDATSFLVQHVRQGESNLKQKLEKTSSQLLDIANHYNMIKGSTLNEDFNIDCGQVQDGLVNELQVLMDEATSVIEHISSSALINSTKHRYFIQYTYGLIEKLEQLVQTVGRLSDIDQRLYREEQRTLLVSDESIMLHSLLSIWTAIITLLDTFCQKAEPVFNPNPEEPDEYDFLDQLEFSTARNNFAKAMLMDLVIVSWIKFNGLVKYDNLVRGQPFLCKCQMQVFQKLISLLTVGSNGASQQEPPTDGNILIEMLDSILDYQDKPSRMTISSTRFGILPQDPCFATSSQLDLTYFIVWYLYSMAKSTQDAIVRKLVAACQSLFDSSSKSAMDSFGSDINSLSPHQKERLQLLRYMIKAWEAFVFQNSTESRPATG